MMTLTRKDEEFTLAGELRLTRDEMVTLGRQLMKFPDLLVRQEGREPTPVLRMEINDETAPEMLEALKEIDPFSVQPPYDHDGECSYCGTQEGQTHPSSCSWEKAKAAIQKARGPHV